MSDKDDKVELQKSKEFQMKLVLPEAGEEPINKAKVDQELFKLVTDTITSIVKRHTAATEPLLNFDINKCIHREGIRYDTKNNLLKQHNLTLAIEATDKRTKLKCKEHNFIPELLFENAAESICFPDIQASKNYDKHGTKFKLEEDLHFSNLKYCASGSLFVKGCSTQVETLAFFSHYFPKLEKLLSDSTPLKILSHWDETVFDDMRVEWEGTVFYDWMLVNRWDWGTKKLLESELSFKVENEMDKKWEYDVLGKANRLYLELKKTGIFMAAPPIFFYDKPVSSVDICVCPK